MSKYYIDLWSFSYTRSAAHDYVYYNIADPNIKQIKFFEKIKKVEVNTFNDFGNFVTRIYLDDVEEHDCMPIHINEYTDQKELHYE